MVQLPVTIDDIRTALVFIDPNLIRWSDVEVSWAKIGMAIKSEFPDESGFDLFNEWSEGGSNYSKSSVRSTWNSIKSGGGVSIGTLLGLAGENGYKPEQKELSPEDKARLIAEAKQRRIDREAKAKAEEKEQRWWYKQISQLSTTVWRELASKEGLSPYLQRKKVMGHNARFVEQPFILYVDVENRTTGTVVGHDAISDFFVQAKGRDKEQLSFRYLKKGALLVPLCDLSGKIWSLQVIYESGSKQFIRNGRKQGLFAVIGKLPRGKDSTPAQLGFVEGYATGGSVFEALGDGSPIVVTFDAGNILAVAQRFREKYPSSHFVFYGDDDSGNDFRGPRFQKDKVSPELDSLIELVATRYPHIPVETSVPGDGTTGSFNTGVTKAMLAAAAVDGTVAFPVFPDVFLEKQSDESCSDWNDLHVGCGLALVSEELCFDIEASDAVTQRLHKVRMLPERTLLQAGEAPKNISNNEYIDEPPLEESPRDIDEAEDYSWTEHFRRNNKGKPLASVGNVKLILKYDPHWRGILKYCDFSYRLIKIKAPPSRSFQDGEWEDADTERTRIWIERHYDFSPKKADVQGALIVVAQEQRFHPVRDYLNSLVWDGGSRINDWLKHSFESTEPPEYLEAAGPRFLIGAVARVMQPGCKMETVLILEGKQGRGKSTVVKELFGEWFSDGQVPIGDKDAYLAIQGIWGQEMAELDAFNKTESNTAKSFFSQLRDRFRPPYGHTMQDFKRQTVFIGTTNQDEYLKDYSGNRRYWPVRCLVAKQDYIKEFRDQLWAEAFVRYSKGEKWWVDDEALQAVFEEVQDSRRQMDPWEEYILDYVDTNETKQFFTTAELLNKAIVKDKGASQRADQGRLSPIMKALGWDKDRQKVPIDSAGKLRWRHGYVRPKDEDAPPLPGDKAA